MPSGRQDTAGPIGSTLLGLGAAGILLLALANLEGLPLNWQRFLRGNAPMWSLASFGLMVAGIRQLWFATHQHFDWIPTRPGQRFETLIVYTRPACPLCEEAVELLAQYRRWLPPVVEVNIDDDPELVSRFGESVPIAEFDSRIRFRGEVNEILLRRLIEGTAPRRRN